MRSRPSSEEGGASCIIVLYDRKLTAQNRLCDKGVGQILRSFTVARVDNNIDF
jgi:hypothetical protein